MMNLATNMLLNLSISFRLCKCLSQTSVTILIISYSYAKISSCHLVNGEDTILTCCQQQFCFYPMNWKPACFSIIWCHWHCVKVQLGLKDGNFGSTNCKEIFRKAPWCNSWFWESEDLDSRQTWFIFNYYRGGLDCDKCISFFLSYFWVQRWRQINGP